MKLYVLPIEKACTARCRFCITDFRNVKNSTPLSLADLDQRLAQLNNLEKIEITGGGEPTLHPQIAAIVQRCADVSPTQLYTHGATAMLSSVFNPLAKLCISRAHYYNHENKRIMGIDYDFQKLASSITIPIKLSLLLTKEGIHTAEEVSRYSQWASAHDIEEIVVRQLFEHDHKKYNKIVSPAFVSTEKIAEEPLQIENVTLIGKTKYHNPLLKIGTVKVEIEVRSCACEMTDPVLHADGRLAKGWNYDLDWE